MVGWGRSGQKMQGSQQGSWQGRQGRRHLCEHERDEWKVEWERKQEGRGANGKGNEQEQRTIYEEGGVEKKHQ